MGVEFFNDDVLRKVNKANPGGVACEAVALLRAAGILTVSNVIHGLKAESWRPILKATRNLRRAGPDYYNTLLPPS